MLNCYVRCSKVNKEELWLTFANREKLQQMKFERFSRVGLRSASRLLEGLAPSSYYKEFWSPPGAGLALARLRTLLEVFEILTGVRK